MKLSETLRQKSDNWDVHKREVIDNISGNFRAMLYSGSLLHKLEESITTECILTRNKKFLFEFSMCDITSIANLSFMGWEHQQKYFDNLPFEVTKQDIIKELIPRMLEILRVYFESEGFYFSYSEPPVHIGKNDYAVKQYVVIISW